MQPGASDEIIEVTITIDLKRYRERLDEVVRMLEERGLTAAVLHARFGVVNGRVASGKLPMLREIDGVVSVREDRTYRAV